MITNANQAGTYSLWHPNDARALLALRERGVGREWLALVFRRSPQAIKRKLYSERNP
jgi:hypothetical protein